MSTFIWQTTRRENLQSAWNAPTDEILSFHLFQLFRENISLPNPDFWPLYQAIKHIFPIQRHKQVKASKVLKCLKKKKKKSAFSTFAKFIKKIEHIRPWQTHACIANTHTRTHTHISAVVVGEVIWARLLWHRRRRFRDRDVLKVEEAELHLHADESI